MKRKRETMPRRLYKRADIERAHRIVTFATLVMLVFYSAIGFGTTAPDDTLARLFVVASQGTAWLAWAIGLRWRRLGAGLLVSSALLQTLVLIAAMAHIGTLPLWVALAGALAYTLPYLAFGALQWRLAANTPPADSGDALDAAEFRLAEQDTADYNISHDGDLVEWLGTGLQNRLRRFDSGSRLLKASH